MLIYFSGFPAKGYNLKKPWQGKRFFYELWLTIVHLAAFQIFKNFLS